jgi:hypothetical protein
MTKRAQKAIPAHYAQQNPAIAALTEFAAQNSGIEPRNYISGPNDTPGVRAYRQEVRSIGDDWKRFKQALQIAIAEGVTDAEVIAEAPHAFSGRLEPIAHCKLWGDKSEHCQVLRFEQRALPGYWIKPSKGDETWMHTSSLSFGWNYCTGQYFPTEYRAAAATLLEYATRAVRLARPKEHKTVASIAELKSLNEQNGGCWFKPAEMRFFGTRIETGIIKGKYFISSEQPPYGPRNYSIRTFDDAGSVDTVGEFGQYNS